MNQVIVVRGQGSIGVAIARRVGAGNHVALADLHQGLNERAVIGRWQTRADWEAWHESRIFAETRERMDRGEVQRKGEWWHEVFVVEQFWPRKVSEDSERATVRFGASFRLQRRAVPQRLNSLAR